MYSEKKFKNYIFWIQVKRVVLIILFSIIGAALGIGIGAILEGTINISTYNNLIIIVLTIVFFLLALLVTAGTGREVQDGYWKIAVLRKLTAIQKTIESSNELIQKNGAIENHFIKTIATQSKEIEKIVVDNNIEKKDIIKKSTAKSNNENEYKEEINSKENKKPSLKHKKNIKKPELV